jgi:hypothetical protein
MVENPQKKNPVFNSSLCEPTKCHCVNQEPQPPEVEIQHFCRRSMVHTVALPYTLRSTSTPRGESEPIGGELGRI